MARGGCRGANLTVMSKKSTPVETGSTMGRSLFSPRLLLLLLLILLWLLLLLLCPVLCPPMGCPSRPLDREDVGDGVAGGQGVRYGVL